MVNLLQVSLSLDNLLQKIVFLFGLSVIAVSPTQKRKHLPLCLKVNVIRNAKSVYLSTDLSDIDLKIPETTWRVYFWQF